MQNAYLCSRDISRRFWAFLVCLMFSIKITQFKNPYFAYFCSSMHILPHTAFFFKFRLKLKITLLLSRMQYISAYLCWFLDNFVPTVCFVPYLIISKFKWLKCYKRRKELFVLHNTKSVSIHCNKFFYSIRNNFKNTVKGATTDWIYTFSKQIQ